MNSQLIKLSLSEWEAQFKPYTNHLDSNASFQNDNDEGIMFETYGDELEFVYSHANKFIWTYIDTEDGGTAIVDGYHLVNRIGYFLTRVAWEDSMGYEIAVSDGNKGGEN